MGHHHQWADAEPLLGPDTMQGDDYYGYHYGETGIEDSFSEPVDSPPPGMTGVRQGWRYVRPDTDIGLNLDVTSWAGTNVITGIWSRINSAWATVLAPTTPAPAPSVHVELSAGVTYYVMFADESLDNWGQGVKWDAYPMRSAAELNADAPSITVSVDVDARVLGETDQQLIPPIVVGVRTPAPFDQPGTQVPAFTIKAGPSVPEIWTGSLVLSAPDDDTVVLTAKPEFMIGVSGPDDDTIYTVELQYADNAAMTGPSTLTATFEAVDGGAVLTPAGPVPDTTYWRARLLEGSTIRLGWSAARKFTVATTTTSTNLPVTWDVSGTADRLIHVWHLDPPGPIVGDIVTIYGQGFPASGSLTFGDLVLPATAWQLVPATSDNTDDDLRRIEGDTVTPEHFEVQFAAPDDDGPGGALVLEG